MTDERNWLDKKTWQLSYSMFSGPDIITDTFFTEDEARQAASFLDMEGRDIVLLTDLVSREIHTLKHPLKNAEVIDFPDREPLF
jgi:hypothetical protein|tara:strand:+ start:347 stop:598 length:252 start_codon:yes stop_codon:yes gene_type:complete